jgi:hypothetical protein
MVPGRTVTLWSANGLTVWARRGAGESLVISGQDLNAGAAFGEVSEYEYGLSVAARDIPAVLAALDAAPGADVLDVLEDAGERVVRAGESTWLASIGVEAQFWSRLE